MTTPTEDERLMLFQMCAKFPNGDSFMDTVRCLNASHLIFAGTLPGFDGKTYSLFKPGWRKMVGFPEPSLDDSLKTDSSLSGD